MVDSEAIEMVRKHLALGKTDAQVRPILQNAGYSKEETAEILLHAKTHEPGTSPHEKRTPVPLIKKAAPVLVPTARPRTMKQARFSGTGSSNPVGQIFDYLIGFWFRPLETMRHVANDRNWISSLILLLITIGSVFGFYRGLLANSYNAMIQQSMASLMIFINPMSTFVAMVAGIPDYAYAFLITAAVVILPLMAITFIVTMFTKGLAGKHAKFREIFRVLLIPHCLVLLFGVLISLIMYLVAYVPKYAGSSDIVGIFILIVMVVAYFLSMFLSIYAYLLYALAIKERYGTSIASSVTIIIASQVIISLFLIVFMLVGMMASFGGGSSLFF